MIISNYLNFFLYPQRSRQRSAQETQAQQGEGCRGIGTEYANYILEGGWQRLRGKIYDLRNLYPYEGTGTY